MLILIFALILFFMPPAFAQDIPPQLKSQFEALAKEKDDILKDAKMGQLMTENAQMRWERALVKEQQLKAQIDAESKANVATKNK